MLERLGISKVAYNWDNKDIVAFDEQIEAFQRHRIEIIGWAITDVDDPSRIIDWKTYRIPAIEVLDDPSLKPSSNAMTAEEMLQMFKRHHIAPTLWLIRRMRPSKPLPQPDKPPSDWTVDENNQDFRNHLGYDLDGPSRDQGSRVRQESVRIKALAKLAAAYGVNVGLYKHGGWLGMSENQVAIIEHLHTLGVTNVGIIYQFVHAHDEVDETTTFPSVWRRIQPYVFAVNITGLHEGRTAVYPILYPSQGDVEVNMMRTIQTSGWKGPIGVAAEKGGDAEINLRNNIVGVDWIAAELARPGSGGPRPFPRSH